MELSPEDIRKDKGKIIPNNFIVYIFFEDGCHICSPYTTEIEDLCDVCKKEIGKTTIDEWLQVKAIMANHDFPDMETARNVICPGVDPALID